MTTKPDYTAIEGRINEMRCLLDLAEDEWHAQANSGRCIAALKAAIRLADDLHLTCCQFKFEAAQI